MNQHGFTQFLKKVVKLVKESFLRDLGFHGKSKDEQVVDQ